MKAIILISSIFYLLGLKVSDKLDIVKKPEPVKKVIMNEMATKKADDAVNIFDANTTTADSLANETLLKENN